MNRIIILTILLINFVSCNSQQGKNICNFKKLNRIQFQIDNHTTNEKSYNSLDSLRKVVDGADAELYVETYKNAIIYDTNEFLNYLRKNHKKIDDNVLDFFRQDEEIFKLINKKLKSNEKNVEKGYIYDSDGYTNLRKHKNKNSEIIQKINHKEEITILDDSDNWWLVETKENNKGYVHKSRIINNLIQSTIINISPNWYGKYFVDIPSTQEYLQTIELNLSSKGCVFKVTSLAENKEYQLAVKEKEEKLYLKYRKLIKFESPYIENDNKLAEEKEFGYLIYDGKKCLWISPYLDYIYSDGKKEKYILKKQKLQQ